MAYPVIKSNVRIFPGSVIDGDIIVEQGATIGANSFVNKNVPSNSTAFGTPVKIKLN